MKSNNKGQKESFFKSHDFKVAILTAFVSLVAVGLTNYTLEKIEIQKYQYSLHETRFEKLQEALDYFARFEVIDERYISRFDINSKEYSPYDALDMVDDSIKEFSAQAEILILYMSNDAVIKMKSDGFLNGEMNSNQLDLSGISSMEVEDANEVIKEYLRLKNKDYDNLANIIKNAIKYDIEANYIPKEESEDRKKMNFESLLEAYPILDIAWELFKGISPTLIAIWTMRVATKQSQKESKEKEIRELQYMAAELVPRIMSIRADIENLNYYINQPEKIKTMIDDIYEKRRLLMLDSGRILAYANIRASINDCNEMLFTNVCNKINAFSAAINEILSDYESGVKNKNELQAVTYDKIKVVTYEVEKTILEYGSVEVHIEE